MARAAWRAAAALLLSAILALSVVSAEEADTFPCEAEDFNTTDGYRTTKPSEDLTMLNLAAAAFEKWLNNGENKTTSCTADSINDYAVNVTNSCVKVVEEGTSYALDFKSKFDCITPNLAQTSATMQFHALAQKPNFTISGKKPSAVITSVKMVDGVEFDRIIIQQLLVRELAPAPGPMMKDIQKSIEQGVARQALIPVAGSPRGAPGPNQAPLLQQYTPSAAMLPMALPMELTGMASAEMQAARMLAPLLNQALAARPLVMAAANEDSNEESAVDEGSMDADAYWDPSTPAGAPVLASAYSTMAASSQDEDEAAAEERASLMSDLMALAGAQQPLRSETAAARGAAAEARAQDMAATIPALRASPTATQLPRAVAADAATTWASSTGSTAPATQRPLQRIQADIPNVHMPLSSRVEMAQATRDSAAAGSVAARDSSIDVGTRRRLRAV